ncbi:MAG TPA: helix-turn-helix transcriptional regulator [Candidatus Mediterraneibacter gallistercoris]|uniref:Helix-turn-helix transcriptional regulator n=1 Tax=Candidatus Mediterraneibacter gallistercoris TaxID=2838671 RepID=A0A9D2P3W3_9FIRM|nr:helix-turn-helix transcriptional regulator [Candidatus Mediterraneibacter gallistercoris]
MELGKQIKKYRSEKALSQDALAEKIYVSRQTISNWENDKSYPDVNSLVLLSKVFNVSLDQLIKGDVEKMTEQINNSADRKEYEHLSLAFTVLLLAIIITPIPLVHFLSYVGMVIWIVILEAGIIVAYRVEKKKSKFDMQTYQEIKAFLEGKSLSEIEKNREKGKRLHQKIFLAILSGLIALAVSLFFIWILGVIPS